MAIFTEAKKQRIWLRAMALGAKTGCHQLPQRSLFWGSWQMPVCARCLGVGLGALAALPAAALRRGSFGRALLLLPMAVDGLSQRFGRRRSNPILRYATGWLAGFGYMSVLLTALFRLLRFLARRNN